MKEWLKDVAIRTIKTMAETAIGLIGAQTLITEVNWIEIASAVALSGIVTILINIRSIPEGDEARG